MLKFHYIVLLHIVSARGYVFFLKFTIRTSGIIPKIYCWKHYIMLAKGVHYESVTGMGFISGETSRSVAVKFDLYEIKIGRSSRTV